MALARTLAVLAATGSAAAGCGTGGDATAPATRTAPAAAAVSCADVVFTPNSDDLAAHVRAAGVDCATARAFIRASDGAPRQGLDGYRCTSRKVSDTLIHSVWRCTKGGALISWQRF